MNLRLSFPSTSHALLALMLTGAGTLAAANDDAQVRDARSARGEAVLTALNNGKPQPVFEAMRLDFPFLADATAGYALGDVWGCDGLDVRTRQLAAMAAFGALGLRPFFKTHAAHALNAGVSPEELKEIVYLITVPAGFPRAIEATQTLHELFVERGIVLKASGQ